MDEHLMRIGEVADYFHVSAKAIRLYEKKGIVKPARVDPSTGYRYYTADQVLQLNALVELKALGFSLAEIARVLQGGASKDALLESLAHKRRAWEAAAAVAEDKIAAIDSMAGRIGDSQQAAQLQALSEEQRAWLLARLVCVEGVWMPPELSQALWL